jgi:uncharacterized protein with PIN domain
VSQGRARDVFDQAVQPIAVAALDRRGGVEVEAPNLGDCFAYGLARTRGEQLLFKGQDFSKTDVEVA